MKKLMFFVLVCSLLLVGCSPNREINLSANSGKPVTSTDLGVPSDILIKGDALRWSWSDILNERDLLFVDHVSFKNFISEEITPYLKETDTNAPDLSKYDATWFEKNGLFLSGVELGSGSYTISVDGATISGKNNVQVFVNVKKPEVGTADMAYYWIFAELDQRKLNKETTAEMILSITPMGETVTGTNSSQASPPSSGMDGVVTQTSDSNNQIIAPEFPVIPLEDVSLDQFQMTAKKATYSKTDPKVTLTIKNNSGASMVFGEMFTLEVYKNGKWESVPFNTEENVGVPDIAIMLIPYSSMDWSPMMRIYGNTFEAGQYRANLEFWISGVTPAPSEGYSISAEFTLE